MPDPFIDGATVLLFMLVVTVAAFFFGKYLARVYSGSLSRGIPGRIEGWIYRLIGTSPGQESGWRQYATDMILFSAIGFAVLLLILLLQGLLPLNPMGLPGFSFHTAVNIATSFVTNTNWQVYSGETAAGYLTQMAGFTVQNFLSAATGIAVAIAVMRGITRRNTDRIGNFWVDLTRTVLYVLLPVAFVAALVLASQGVIQNLDPYPVTGGGSGLIAMGPVASQEAIKELGTNGGGFFNANAAHPFENPNPFTNLFEVFLILIIPASLPFTFGEMCGNRREGAAIYAAMLVLFLLAFTGLYLAELGGNPALPAMGISGVPMEGKEVRFGLGGTALYAVATTATSCGSVNAMHDSLTPLAGMVPLLLILLGEVVFGGVGSGFYTYLAFIVVAVFIAGLMIGRTPEYLGKKMERREITMAVLVILVPALLVLLFTGVALLIPAGSAAMLNPGPHGLSELIYAYASMANNNGSAFAGFDATAPFFTLTGALVMALGRFVPAVAMLALAGTVAGKKTVPAGPGTLPTAQPAFVLWMLFVIVIVGVLTFFPVLTMGPVAEHLLMIGGA
ncbi:MAG: potassium-transporting ATPase subunit KdpA [Methanomicrobiales archaeon]|nr:potassium-transporting ATPase subunit KdpA [Methanomicrobiales archaeon]